MELILQQVVILLRPEILSNAILFRPMIPSYSRYITNLSDKHILISAGSHDPIVPSHQTEDLFDLLRNAGATYLFNGKIVDMS